jgi:hydroxymethylglutaryl-CoA synthase
MLVSEDPDLVAFSAEQGFGSADETDFLKPQQQFPSVDGKRSVQVYLARMREALEDFEAAGGDTHPDNFAFIPFHTPFPGMVRKAAALGYRHAMRGTGIEDDLAEEIGRQPRPEAFDDDEAYLDAVKEYTDALTETDHYRRWYADTVEPTLGLSREVGNWYTGSVHIARTAALQYAEAEGMDVTGDRLLVGSYGSGAQAEMHTETIQPGWRAEIRALDVDEQLDARYELTFEEYEDVHDAHNHDVDDAVDSFTEPDGEFVFDGWGGMGEREYSYVE